MSTRMPEQNRAYVRTSPLEDMFVLRTIEENTPSIRTLFSERAFLSVLSLLIPLSLFVGNTSTTILYFSDSEASSGNTFAAGPLDISLSPNGLVEGTISEGESGVYSIAPVLSHPLDTLPYSYEVSATVSGNQPFCNALLVDGSAPPLSYSGLANAFSAGPTEDTTPWNLTFSIPDGSLITGGAQCLVHLVYSAYQHNGALLTEYHDEEHVDILLTYVEPVLPLQLVVPEMLRVLPESFPPEETASSTEEALEGGGEETSEEEESVPAEGSPTPPEEPSAESTEVLPDSPSVEPTLEDVPETSSEPAPETPSETA